MHLSSSTSLFVDITKTNSCVNCKAASSPDTNAASRRASPMALFVDCRALSTNSRTYPSGLRASPWKYSLYMCDFSPSCLKLHADER